MRSRFRCRPGGLLPHPFTLTPGQARGGFLSVALSIPPRLTRESTPCRRGFLLCGVRTFLPAVSCGATDHRSDLLKHNSMPSASFTARDRVIDPANAPASRFAVRGTSDSADGQREEPAQKRESIRQFFSTVAPRHSSHIRGCVRARQREIKGAAGSVCVILHTDLSPQPLQNPPHN